MIEHLLINAAFIMGLSIISQGGYILHFYRRICERVPFFHKPLITCRVCMSSIYGIAYLLFVLNRTFTDVLTQPNCWIYLMALAFTVALFCTLFEMIGDLRIIIGARHDEVNRKMMQEIENLKSE